MMVAPVSNYWRVEHVIKNTGILSILATTEAIKKPPWASIRDAQAIHVVEENAKNTCYG
jgi:hypothetical protein